MHQFFSDLIENIESASHLDMGIIILGDLNIDCSPNVFNSKNKIYQICELFDFMQLVKCPTRVTPTSKTLIDVILSNMGDKHKETIVVEISMSDHFMICTTIINNDIVIESEQITCRSFKNFQTSEFLNDLSVTLNTCLPLYTFESFKLVTVWQLFKSIFISTCDKHAPLRSYKIKGGAKPRITYDIIDLIKNRDKLHSKAIKRKNIDSISEFRKARNKVNIAIKKAKRDYFKQSILSSSNYDSGNLWKTFKEFIGNKKNPSSYIS